MFDPPEETYFTVVKKGNTPSEKSLNACGFSQWKPDPELLLEREAILGLVVSGVNYFAISSASSYKTMAADLVSLADSPILTSKTTGERIALDLAIPLFESHFELLNMLAKG